MQEPKKPTALPTSGPAFDDVIERFRAFLASKGLRFTRERSELLSAIFQAPRHFEAEDLIRTVDERESRVSRATIYRTLGLLEECGILRKSLFGHNRHFYESTVGRHHHDHLVCIRCGQIREFEEDRIEDLQEEICTRFGYTIVDHVHEIFGICGECREREGNNPLARRS
ncbi:MAG: transcriptional repressor [Candidatus Eisenbacteria bacterium]|uniref:Transcriptional repressor n=1 Tax=Eiseniibacteriota bacterium TaxID=2212470 RepID=A0A956RSU1_UNCEI|nr:transcriptional repressor [Candidatus Eisenbacteria bacterium]